MKAQKVLGWLSFLSLFFGILIKSVYEHARSIVNPTFSAVADSSGTGLAYSARTVEPSSWAHSLLQFTNLISVTIFLLGIIFLISFISYLVVRLKNRKSSVSKN